MIRASAQSGDGRRLMLLGLSGENVTRLAAGEPIMFDADQLGYPGKVVIVYGKTEADIEAELRGYGVALPGTEG